MQRHIHVPAVNVIAHQLPHLRLKSLPSFGDMRAQVEKAMIDASQAHPQVPAIVLGAGLSVTRHRTHHFKLRRAAHDSKGPAGEGAGSLSVNCSSYSRAYVPLPASTSPWGPNSAITPSFKTRVLSARPIVDSP